MTRRGISLSTTAHIVTSLQAANACSSRTRRFWWATRSRLARFACANHCRLRASCGWPGDGGPARDRCEDRGTDPVPDWHRRAETEKMPQVTQRMREFTGCRPDRLPLEDLLAAAEPCVLRGLVSDWGITRAGLRSRPRRRWITSAPSTTARPSAPRSAAEIDGRLFYNEDFTKLNFAASAANLKTCSIASRSTSTTPGRRRSTSARL